VVNDWCAVRAAVPENTVAGVSWTLNPYCHVESPFQTSFNGLASYVIPKIDVLLSGVYRDRRILNGTPNNASTDQLAGSLPANLTFTATDAFGAAIAQQIGRPMTGGPFVNVNLITPGTLYGGAPSFADRNRQIDLSLKKIIRMGGRRLTPGLLPLVVEHDPLELSGRRHFAFAHPADKRVSLPGWKAIAGVEHEARRRDRRHPENDRLLETGRGRRKARAVVVAAVGHDR